MKFILNAIFLVCIFIVTYSQSSNNLKDIDGNHYKTIIIGDQIWMAENLRSTRYADGTSIPNITDNTEWGKLGDNDFDRGWCWYLNNDTYAVTKGAIYTWAAASNGEASNQNPSGVQGVCPEGWHLPARAEWVELINYISDKGFEGKEGSALKSATNWNGTDNFSFSANPVGYRSHSHGDFRSFSNCRYWMSDVLDSESAKVILIDHADESVILDSYLKSYGVSVRCVKNQRPEQTEIIITSQPKNILVDEGELIEFEIHAEGESLSFQWEKDGEELRDNERISGSNSNHLIIRNAISSDIGEYRCVVSNGGARLVSHTATLTMNLRVDIPESFVGWEYDVYKEFELFGTLYRVRSYAAEDIPVLNNTTESFDMAVLPIITYLPDRNKPELELAVTDRYKLGMLLNYVYYNYDHLSDILSKHGDNRFWPYWAENANQLADVFNPNKATSVNLLFAGSKIFGNIGLSMLFPHAVPANLEKGLKIIEGAKLVFEIGEGSLTFIENVTSRPNDNTMSMVMSAQSNLSPELYERYSKTPKDYAYILRGFEVGNTVLSMPELTVFFAQEYNTALKSIHYFNEGLQAVGTEFGEIALRNGSDLATKVILDGSELILQNQLEKTFYRHTDELGEAVTDWIWMGHMHARTMEAYALDIENRRIELEKPFNTLAELDSAITLYRYSVMKFFEVMAAYTANIYVMEKGIHHMGVKGRIAISARAVEANRQSMINVQNKYRGFIDELIKVQSVKQYLFDSYPGFEQAQNKRSFSPNNTLALSDCPVSMVSVGTDHFGQIHAGDTITLTCTIENLFSPLEENIMIDVFDNGNFLYSMELDSIRFMEKRQLSKSYAGSEGYHDIRMVMRGCTEQTTSQSLSLFVLGQPSLKNPNVDTLENGYVFSIDYYDENQLPEDEVMVFLNLDNQTLKLSKKDDISNLVSRYASAGIELGEGYHSYFYTLFANGEWNRLPELGYFELNNGLKDTAGTVQLISPKLEDDLSMMDNIRFVWSVKHPLQVKNFLLRISADPSMETMYSGLELTDTMSMCRQDIFLRNHLYYWQVSGISDAGDTTHSEIQALIIEQEPVFSLDSVYSICANEPLKLDFSTYDLSYVNKDLFNSANDVLDEPGTYHILVYNEFGLSDSTELRLEINPIPAVYLGEDTTIHLNEAIVLAPDGYYASYLWNTGSVDPSITVSSAEPGLYEYTLTVSDANNCVNSDTIQIHFLPNTALRRQETGNDVLIYPNPATNHMYILDEGFHMCEIRIYDLNGKLLITDTIEKRRELYLDVSTLSPGQYLMVIEGEGNQKGYKILIQ